MRGGERWLTVPALFAIAMPFFTDTSRYLTASVNIWCTFDCHDNFGTAAWHAFRASLRGQSRIDDARMTLAPCAEQKQLDNKERKKEADWVKDKALTSPMLRAFLWFFLILMFVWNAKKASFCRLPRSYPSVYLELLTMHGLFFSVQVLMFIFVNAYVCMYVCMYVRTYVCMCVCMYVCIRARHEKEALASALGVLMPLPTSFSTKSPVKTNPSPW